MTGSIQAKSGKLYILLNTYTPEHKRKQKWISTGLSATNENREIAQARLSETLSSYPEQPFKKNSQKAKKPTYKPMRNISREMPFVDYIKYWLEVKARKTNPVTMQHYTITATTHIIPYFKEYGYRLCDINYAVLRDYFDEKSAEGRLDGKPGGLSAKTLRHHKTVLSLVLKEACRERLIERMDIDLIEISGKGNHDIHPYDEAEVKQMLEALKDEPLFPLIYITLMFGLRRSEALGIMWKSVDFDKNCIHIEHTLSMCTHVVEQDRTKTSSSNRYLYFDDNIKNMLLHIKSEQAENKILFGSEYNDTGYVFTKADGNYINPDYYTKNFRKLLLKHSLRPIRLHDLRHTAASILIAEGWEIQSVSNYLGHSNVKITSEYYCHPFEGTIRNMCNTLVGVGVSNRK